MQTKNLIQTQANVIKITNLKIGDVVKIVDKKYGDSYKIYYGVVLEMLNSGNDTFIQIAKYEKDYSRISTEIKTYSGKDELNLFPATIEEVENHFEEAVMSIENEIKQKEEELQKEKAALKIAKEFVSGEKSKKLTEASFTEIKQEDYDKKNQELLN